MTAPGTTTSPEVTQIDRFGVWILVQDKEHFLSYTDFPWFTDAKLSDILAVTLVAPNHLRWPTLDVDVSLESVEHPEAFPLIYHV